ncbi:MAG TPA: putative porin, partial [bacterium]|nr:putative porin [bacterium]
NIVELRNFKLAALALVGLLAAAPLAADSAPSTDVQDSMEDLRSSLGNLASQVNNLDKTVSSLIKFSGDLRFRYENVIDRSVAAPTDPDRERYRFRLRLNADAKVSDWVGVRTRVASDTTLLSTATTSLNAGGDPVSTNQTMTDYANDKPLYIDVAEIDIAPKVMLHPKASFGKLYTPFYVVPGEFVFDADLTPEGIYVGLNQDVIHGLNLAVNESEFFTNEIKASTLDGKMEGSQGVISYDFGIAKATVSGAYYNWQNTTGADAFKALSVGAVSQDNNTNSAALGFWIDDYTADIKSSIAGIGLDAYYEYTYNAQQHADNIGSLVGVELASGKLIPMDTDYLKVSYCYRNVQKNYTFSPWNFSDFANGETDARGGVTQVKLKAIPGAETDFTYFSNTRGLDAIAAAGKGKTYERYQVDLLVKF